MAIRYNPLTGNFITVDDDVVQNFETIHYKGLANLSTAPIAQPTDGDWYTATVNGTYVNFGNIIASAGNKLIFDNGIWNAVSVIETSFVSYINTDPASLGNPPAGEIWDGTFDGRKWLKDENGEINYLLTEAEFYALTS